MTLQTNGVPNPDQTLLNIAAGENITLTDNGSGEVTFDATVGGGPAFNSQADVTLSRAYNTSYHNSSAQPLLVVVSNALTGQGSLVVHSDANPVPTLIIAKSIDGGVGNAISFIVLPGNYYRVVDLSAPFPATLISWIETTKS